MATCFVFLEHLDAEGGLCLRLNAEGEVEAPLLRRSPEDIRALQAQARTLIVAPTTAAAIHVFDLPWLGVRKAREALPYALEERLAQPVTELHFALDKTHYQDGKYLIVVVDKQQLRDWMALLNTLNLDFDQLTVDWFALNPHEVCITPNAALIHHDDFKGALSPSLARDYLIHASESSGFVLDDSMSGVLPRETYHTPGTSALFIAKRLARASFINLCQGEFRHDTAQETQVRWKHVTGLLFGVWLLSLLAMNALNLHRLNTQQAEIDTRIAAIYHVFFPDADVISPKFRVEQALKANASGQQGAFWYVFGQLVASYKPTDPLTIDQVRFQNQTLTVNVTSEDFATLEAFEHRLKQAKLQVTQTQASSQKKQVVAILELRG